MRLAWKWFDKSTSGRYRYEILFGLDRGWQRAVSSLYGVGGVGGCGMSWLILSNRHSEDWCILVSVGELLIPGACMDPKALMTLHLNRGRLYRDQII